MPLPTTSVKLAWDYHGLTGTQLAQYVKEFRVYKIAVQVPPSDPSYNQRLTPPVVVTTLPTDTVPLTLSGVDYGQNKVEVVPVDLADQEGASFFFNFAVKLPAVQNVRLIP